MSDLINKVEELDEYQMNILKYFFAQPEAWFTTSTLATIMGKNFLNPAHRRRLSELVDFGILDVEEEPITNLIGIKRLYRLHPDLIEFAGLAMMSLGRVSPQE